MAKFSDELISTPCCLICSSRIQQLTEDLARLEEGFAIDNVQCLKLKVCQEENQPLREENQQLRSMLEERGIPYG